MTDIGELALEGLGPAGKTLSPHIIIHPFPCAVPRVDRTN